MAVCVYPPRVKRVATRRSYSIKKSSLSKRNIIGIVINSPAKTKQNKEKKISIIFFIGFTDLNRPY